MINNDESIIHHENGDSEFTFKVKMIVGASDKQGSSVDVGGMRFRIQSYYNEETKKEFFVLQEGSYDTRIYGSPEFENVHSATRWLINYIKGN